MGNVFNTEILELWIELFYFKNGYEAQGDYFEEDFIPHLKMNKVL